MASSVVGTSAVHLAAKPVPPLKRQSSFHPSGGAEALVGYQTTHLTGRQAFNFSFFTNSNLIRMPLHWLVLVFLISNFVNVVLFALLYYAAGAECFVLQAQFSLPQMLWLSIVSEPRVNSGAQPLQQQH